MMEFQMMHCSSARNRASSEIVRPGRIASFPCIRCGLLSLAFLCCLAQGLPAAQSDDGPAMDDLIANLGNKELKVREESVDSLVGLGPEAVDRLIAALGTRLIL